MVGKRNTTTSAQKSDLNEYQAKYVRDSLQYIIDALNSCSKQEDLFFDAYPEWRTKRENNIIVLNQLADELDTHSLNCNISKIVGASVGIIGGIASICGSIALTIATAGATTPLVIAAAGGTASALGVLTTAGSAVAGVIIKKQKAEKINFLLNADKKEFEDLLQWMKRTERLEHAVEHLLPFDTFVEFLKVAGGLSNKIQEVIPRHVIADVFIIIDQLPISELVKEKLRNIISTIFSSQECLNLFHKIIEHGYIIYLAVQNRNTSRDMYDSITKLVPNLLGISAGVGEAVINVVRKIETVRTLSVNPIFVGISAVSIAIDVFSLVLTSKDMFHGSKSKLATKLRQCIIKMQEELDIFEKAYFDILDKRILAMELLHSKLIHEQRSKYVKNRLEKFVRSLSEWFTFRFYRS